MKMKTGESVSWTVSGTLMFIDRENFVNIYYTYHEITFSKGLLSSLPILMRLAWHLSKHPFHIAHEALTGFHTTFLPKYCPTCTQ